jgi:predicted Zn-dependent protease with MMP-like domain
VDPEELARRAWLAVEAEQWGSAEKLARKALESAPSLPAAEALIATLLAQERYHEAIPHLRRFAVMFPADLALITDLGLSLFQVCEFEQSRAVLARALTMSPRDAHVNYLMGLCVERTGDFRAADRYFRRAARSAPHEFPFPTRFSRAEFDTAVRTALRGLPPEIRDALETVAICVEDLPSNDDLRRDDPPLDPGLFGLYTGVPLIEHSGQDLPEVPDSIHLYQRNLERHCPTPNALVREVRTTLLHEVGHHLGLDEDELAQRGLE